MYGIFTYIWVIIRANVGKYSIHGAYGLLLKKTAPSAAAFEELFNCKGLGGIALDLDVSLCCWQCGSTVRDIFGARPIPGKIHQSQLGIIYII